MSRRDSPEKAARRYCTYKDRYDSESVADQAIPTINARLRSEGRKTLDHSYHCQYCGYWHHTSQPRILVMT